MATEAERRDARYKRAVVALNKYVAQRGKMGIAKAKLATIALGRIPGGWIAAFPILRKVVKMDETSDAARLLAAWDELGGREDITPEEIAEAAGMTPGHMIGVVAEAAYETGVTASKLIEALNLEDIMDRAVREAKKPAGFKDRERILQSAGLYPTSSGATFINNPTAIAGASMRGGPAAGMDEELGSMEADTVEFTTLVRGSTTEKKIESPSKLIEVSKEDVTS